MAITYFPPKISPSGKDIGSRLKVFILGYDDKAVELFKATLRKQRQPIFEPRAVVTAFLEMEKDKTFREVRQQRGRLNEVLLYDTNSVSGVILPDKQRNVDDNVGLYMEVSRLNAEILQPWRQQILSLKAQVDNDDPQFAFYLHQLSLQYEQRISRCEVITQGAALAYQMVGARLKPAVLTVT